MIDSKTTPFLPVANGIHLVQTEKWTPKMGQSDNCGLGSCRPPCSVVDTHTLPGPRPSPVGEIRLHAAKARNPRHFRDCWTRVADTSPQCIQQIAATGNNSSRTIRRANWCLTMNAASRGPVR
jgi:hypothetical protein